MELDTGETIMAQRKQLTLRSRSINTNTQATNSGINPAVNKAPSINQKVIRDAFSIPQNDYDLIAKLRQECLIQGIPMNKGEIIRAGLHALNNMTPSELKEIARSVEKIKTGRPANK